MKGKIGIEWIARNRRHGYGGLFVVSPGVRMRRRSIILFVAALGLAWLAWSACSVAIGDGSYRVSVRWRPDTAIERVRYVGVRQQDLERMLRNLHSSDWITVDNPSSSVLIEVRFSDRTNKPGQVWGYAQSPEIVVLAGKMKGESKERIRMVKVPKVNEGRAVTVDWKRKAPLFGENSV